MWESESLNQPAAASLGASLVIAPPTWAWQTLSASLSLLPPPVAQLDAALVTSANVRKTLRPTLWIKQAPGGGVLIGELNWNRGPYESFEALLAAAMGGGTEAQVVAEQFVAPAENAPGQGVP